MQNLYEQKNIYSKIYTQYRYFLKLIFITLTVYEKKNRMFNQKHFEKFHLE